MTTRRMKPKAKAPSPPPKTFAEREPEQSAQLKEMAARFEQPPSAPTPAHDKVIADMIPAARDPTKPCVDRVYEHDDIKAAQTRPPSFWERLDNALGIFDKPARLIVWAFGQVCVWISASVLAALCASLFMFIAVKSYPMWPVWFHRIADVIALITA
jgi:hypothetical protein